MFQKISEEFYCEKCDYKCFNKSNLDKHFLSKNHMKSSKMFQNVSNVIKCDLCSYSCEKESVLVKHINTKKHISNAMMFDKHVCECGKKFKSKRTINFHKKNCIIIKKNEEEETKTNNMQDNVNGIKNELFVSIMSEIKVMMSEQNKIIQDITVNNNSSNTINNNITNNNQQFNLNVFLNETCKDAMNLSEFLENMHVSMEDMEKTGELGFAKGMSRIIMNNLNAIDVCKRPIHCSDVKRETLYVKNNGVWEKETEERKRTKEIIYKVSCLNEKQLIKWRDLPRNKGYEKSDHKKNDEFTKLVMEINKLRDEELDKVITTVSKHVTIDKVKMSGYLN
jgi:hypothetical protein